MKTILVTGANGYLASYIQKVNDTKFNWIPMTRKDADLSKPEEVEKFLSTQKFDICFHTAANATTAVCEENPELAHKINVESTQKVIEACKKNKARLIFCSTEQCFNGKKTPGPYTEEEPLEAVTVYGQNKIECEDLIHDQLEDAVILRYSWMMGLSFPGVKASPSIVKNVMNALLHGTPALFTVNEKRGMTYAKHLANQFDKIVELPSGTYHVSCTNDLNTYEAACLVAKKLGASQHMIDHCIIPNHDRYEDRFRDYRLDTQKIESHGIHFGSFEENIDELLKDFGW